MSCEISFNIYRLIPERSTTTAGKKDGHREVYNWTFISCLEMWVHLVCSYPNEPEIQPLIYPIGQLILGVVRLVPTPRYFPLALHCCRLATLMSRATGNFLPIAPSMTIA